MYDPKLSHFAVPVSMMLPGGAIIHHYGAGIDSLALAIPFYFGGIAATVWMIGQGWLGYMADIEMSRSANVPQVRTEETHEPEQEYTTGNVNIPMEPVDGFQSLPAVKPVTIGLKQTKKGWSLTGLGGRKHKHQLTAEMIAMQKTTESPYCKPDSEMLVAGRLIVQRNNNLVVDLRESYWVKGKHFPESADKFRRMLAKWAYYAIIERQGTNGNSTWIVTNWKKMRGIANGIIPTPPAGY